MSIESRSAQYGSIFGDWHIEKFLGAGSGGKSAVFSLYRENQNGWREYSALKVISLIEERGQQEALPEFRKNEYSTAVRAQRTSAELEVQLMDQLRGKTNIVDYLDHNFFNWSDETGFGVDLLIRMEKLTDIRGQLQEGRLYSEEEIIRIGKDICQALKICHGKNILHRDIKPENIFFNEDQDYKLGDFGIARIMDMSTFHASTGIGTPQYWAPEQISGSYDARVDIYSLGLVLYELGNRNRLPFAATSYVREMEIQKRMLGTPLPTPCAVSEGLAAVILKACAFRPEDRYQSAEEFYRDLDSIPIAASQPSPSVQDPYATSLAGGVFRTQRDMATADMPVRNETPRTQPQTPFQSVPAAQKKSETEGNNTRIGLIPMTVLGVFLALVLAIILNFFGTGSDRDVGTKGNTVKVPDVVGKQQDEAGDMLLKKDLQAKYKYEASAESVGTVIAQSPVGGSSVAKDSEVLITVSQGEETMGSVSCDIVYRSSNGTNLGKDTATYPQGTTNTIVPPSFAGYTTPTEQTVVCDSAGTKTVIFVYDPVAAFNEIKSGCIFSEGSYKLNYSAEVEYRNRTETSVQLRVIWTASMSGSQVYNSFGQSFIATVGNVNTGSVAVTRFGEWKEMSSETRSATAASEWITVPLNTTNATSVDMDIYYYQVDFTGRDMTSNGTSHMHTSWIINTPAY